MRILAALWPSRVSGDVEDRQRGLLVKQSRTPRRVLAAEVHSRASHVQGSAAGAYARSSIGPLLLLEMQSNGRLPGLGSACELPLEEARGGRGARVPLPAAGLHPTAYATIHEGGPWRRADETEGPSGEKNCSGARIRTSIQGFKVPCPTLRRHRSRRDELSKKLPATALMIHTRLATSHGVLGKLALPGLEPREPPQTTLRSWSLPDQIAGGLSFQAQKSASILFTAPLDDGASG
jgi:hypothetical protein